MSIHGLCFDIGMSGKCCNNCYVCSDEHGGEIATSEIINNVGADEQLKMLKEYTIIENMPKITMEKIVADELTNSNDWEEISRYRNLSKDIIRECKDKLYWEYICMCQTLSESFIKEFEDYVNWGSVFKFQILSEEFMTEFNQHNEEDIRE